MNYFGVSARYFGPKRVVAFQYQHLSPGTRQRSSNSKTDSARANDNAVAGLSHPTLTSGFGSVLTKELLGIYQLAWAGLPDVVREHVRESDC